MTDLISRDDAIRELSGACSNWEDDAKVQEIVMAIPSAEAVTHGRLIDADALSEKLCETTIFIKDGEVFQRMINDAPTVSAEAVQGEWIYKLTDESIADEWVCSKCGDWTFVKTNFCPNCGAKMHKGGDE